MFARSIGLLLVSLVLTSPVLADDWPQWRGPNRNGQSAETKLLKTWPKGGPKLLWTCKDAGIGFSSPAIVGDKLFCMGTKDKGTEIYCLSVKEGKELWHAHVGPKFSGIVGWGGGPRSGPTVDGGYVYGLTGNGILACVNAKDGKLVWHVDFVKDFGGAMMTGWGYSESILIDGDHLICTPGSQTKGTFAALDKKTGKVIWMSNGLKNKATYSSLMKTKFGGVPQYLGLSFDAKESTVVASGIDVKDGKVLWTFSLDTGDIDVIASSPLIKGDQAFISIGDSTGSYMLKVTKKGTKFEAENVFEDFQRNMFNMHGGLVLLEDKIYGFSEIFNYMCLDWKTGQKVWFNRPQKVERNASGAISYANGQLYLYSDSGIAVLIEASPKGWEEKGRFTIPTKSTQPPKARKIWTHPVIANGRLYLRDNEYLFSFDISAK